MRDEKPKPGQAQTSSVTVIVRSVALVLALVCGLTLFATAGHDYLPGIRRAKYVVWAIAALVGTATLLVIWRHRHSLFDQWLLIVTLDVILEMGIVGLDATRFSVAFYASRLFSLLISTIVLVILLVETMRLYAKVARSNEAKIRRLVDANILGVCIWSLDGAVVAANEEFLRTLKYDHQDVVSGRIHWTDLTPPELRERDARAVVELRSIGSFQPFEKEYLRRDGSRVPVLVGGALFEEGGNEGVAFVLDLTERKRAEAEARESEQRYREVQLELAHAGRLATLGQLTASIVHEINQPIAANILSAETAQRWLSHQPPNLQEAGQAIDRAVKGGKRAMDIVGRIRALVKKAPTQKDELELNEAILEVIGLARGEMSKNGVRLQTRLSGDLPLIRGDRVQLQQVMLNLVINAVEAMCQVSDDNRELMISTHTEGDCVLVAVRDSGPGLSQVDLERAFEAFYTTKSSGLGMGLSICRSIVEAHKGRLWAAANIPKGAVFRFTVPIHA
jgi:PAS domain S-box-containing protein